MTPTQLRSAEPWLFERQGWDWRWLSWGEAAGRVDRLVAAGFGDEGGWEAGATVAGVLGSLAQARQAGVLRPSGSGWPEAVPMEAPALHGGEALGETAGLWAGLADSEVGARVVALARSLGVGTERDVSLLGSSPASAQGRQLVAWSVFTGAALVLEPQADAYLPTAFWARPTVLRVSGDELAVLTRDLARLKKGRRSPLGRLRALLVDSASKEAAAVWRERGVALVGLAG